MKESKMKKLVRVFTLMALLVLPVSLLAQAGNDKERAKSNDVDSSQVRMAAKLPTKPGSF